MGGKHATPTCFYCNKAENEHAEEDAKHAGHDCYDEACDPPCQGFRENHGEVTAQEVRAEKAERELAMMTTAEARSANAFREAAGRISSLESRVALLERVLNLVEAIAMRPSAESDRWGSPPRAVRWGA